MKEKGLPEPVDLLKVAHRGSPNGMPFEGEESAVPLLLKGRKKTKPIAGTRKSAYGKTAETGIPNPRLMK